jgi:hypothetical protein
MGEERIKDDGRGEFKYDVFGIVKTFVNAAIYLQNNNKNE